MSFPQDVQTEALTSCGRCCCICHKFCSTKIELHHIVQKAYGGDDSLDNCIPLCFDCHSDMGKADPKHAKGKRYTEEELKRHRDNWYKMVKSGVYHADNSKTAICKEDIELFHSICNLFTPSVKFWLIESDIGGAHPYSIFHGLVEYMNNINDPFSEFIDSELEKLRSNLNSSIKKFLAFKATNTFVRHIGENELCVTREWMVTHENWAPISMDYDEYSVLYAEEAQNLNDLATDVWNTYCEFARQGRYRLEKIQSK